MTCLECQSPLAPSRGPHERKFCCDDCRRAFNNRRQQRGAQIYDMFMAMRYDRAAAADLGVWGFMCRMAEAWHDDDVAHGRASFGDYAEFMRRNPSLNPSVSMRMPAMKIGRMR